jgi:hypothetical protein
VNREPRVRYNIYAHSLNHFKIVEVRISNEVKIDYIRVNTFKLSQIEMNEFKVSSLT